MIAIVRIAPTAAIGHRSISSNQETARSNKVEAAVAVDAASDPRHSS